MSRFTIGGPSRDIRQRFIPRLLSEWDATTTCAYSITIYYIIVCRSKTMPSGNRLTQYYIILNGICSCNIYSAQRRVPRVVVHSLFDRNLHRIRYLPYTVVTNEVQKRVARAYAWEYDLALRPKDKHRVRCLRDDGVSVSEALADDVTFLHGRDEQIFATSFWNDPERWIYARRGLSSSSSYIIFLLRGSYHVVSCCQDRSDLPDPPGRMVVTFNVCITIRL